MQAGNVVDVAIEQIADGMPVDWNALQSGASDEDREFLKVLHVLDGLAGLHRSTDADGSSIDASVCNQPNFAIESQRLTLGPGLVGCA